MSGSTHYHLIVGAMELIWQQEDTYKLLSLDIVTK
jgi:hypothetical protein